MSYAYIKHAYGLDFSAGDRVRHNETNKLGNVRRERPAQAHYVYVLFDGERDANPCHPRALDKVAE